MNKEYSEYSANGSEKEEDYVSPKDKLLNGSDEYQEGNAPIQMLFKEKASHHTSEYSLVDVDNDVNEKTSIRMRKKNTRRIVVSGVVLSVVLIALLTALGFTLLHASFSKNENVTSSPDPTFTEVPSTTKKRKILLTTPSPRSPPPTSTKASTTRSLTTITSTVPSPTTSLKMSPTTSMIATSTTTTSPKTSTMTLPKTSTTRLPTMSATTSTVPSPTTSPKMSPKTSTTTSSPRSLSKLSVCRPSYHSAPDGVLLSPGFRTNQNYGSNLDCMYHVTVQADYTVLLTVNSFTTERNYDKLYIYDGSSTTSPLLAEWSGTVADRTQLESTGNTLTVRFVTDGSNNQAGFSIKYSQSKNKESDQQLFRLNKEAAERGDANAQYNLGVMYQNGRGVLQSDERAVIWYRSSAGKGVAEAQVNLGWMYVNGRGVPQSDEEAIKWFWKSAQQGNAAGENNLGTMYAYGRGVPQSDVEAVKWYRKSAEQGDASGQNNLGSMYANGRGVPQSDKVAVKWYRKSAEQEDADGENNLGTMYANGRGVPQSDEEAVKWFTKSAEQGNAGAQHNLGLMYVTGRGVTHQSDEEAVKWFTRSAEQGNANAQRILQIINSPLWPIIKNNL